tara:strand:+ start:5261 stop:6067 length:807 start_codon:yes stop_codon:yes gene_type:complete
MSINTFDKIKNLLLKLILKFNGKKFIYLFNFLSFIFFSKNKIKYKNNFYYCSEKRWRFSNKSQGLYAYVKGFEKRKKKLIDTYLINKIDFNDEDVILDVGANNGDFYLCFDKKINYYGYEPSPMVYANLEHNVLNQNLFNTALWKSSVKKIEFYLKDEFGDSSIIPIKNFSEKIVINTTTLDNVIDEISKPIKLIKLESEGAEPEILEGLKKNLSLVEYITIDCGFERGEDQKSTIAECCNYLLSNNFEFTNFGYPRIVALFKNKMIK